MHRLALRQHRSLQECQRATTSSEFVEWLCVLEDEEWHEVTKQDQYLAALTAQVKQILVMFGSSKPRAVTLEECLLKFRRQDAQAQGSPLVGKQKLPDLEQGDSIEGTGWEEVNRQAKGAWGAFFGIKELTGE